MITAQHAGRPVGWIGRRAPMAMSNQARKRVDESGGCPHAGLVERIGDGDRDAVGELYDSTSSLVFGLALRILGDRHSAEDVLIDVYTEAWRRARAFDQTRGSVAAWLLTITRTRAIDALRSRRRREGTVPVEAAGGLISEKPNPEETALAVERHHLVHGALRELTPDQLEVIQLAYFGGLSHREIASRVGQPLGTVKTRIRLGMVRLRQLLGSGRRTFAVSRGKRG